jgi:hypothetical protein
MCVSGEWLSTVFQNIFTNNFFKQISLDFVPIAN